MTVRNRVEIVIIQVRVVATTQETITSKVAEVTSLAKVVAVIIRAEVTNRVKVAVDTIKGVAVISPETMITIKVVEHLVKIIEIRVTMILDILAHLSVATCREAIAAEAVADVHLKAVADMGEGITAAEVDTSHVVHLIPADLIRIVHPEKIVTRIMTIMAINAHRKIKNRAQKNGLLLLREQAI